MSVERNPEYYLKQSRNIPNFGYWGDYELGVTHAFMYSIHRDSNLLDESNWETIIQALDKLDPDNLEHDIVHCNHWLVGWIDHLVIKVYFSIEENTTTGCFDTMLDFLAALDNYPVLNEELYSEKESEMVFKYLENEINFFEGKGFLRSKHPKDLVWRVYQDLNYVGEDDLPDWKEIAEILEDHNSLNKTAFNSWISAREKRFNALLSK